MKQSFSIYKIRTLWLFVLIIMIIPTAILLLLIKVFQSPVQNLTGYILLHMLLMVCVLTPFFVYLTKRHHKYVQKLTHQQHENIKVKELLALQKQQIKYQLTLPNRQHLYKRIEARVQKDVEYPRSAQREIKLLNDLWTALHDGQLSVFYQPLIDFSTGNVSSVEALLRWKHPEFGFVAPDEFIPLAEQTGDIIPIGSWVLHTACKQVKQWRNKGYTELQVSVNVSIRQIEETNFTKLVERVLKEEKLTPGALKIEITESIMPDIKEANVIFNQLKELGVQIVIDDFGTGYSSLILLGLLDIDFLTIDRTFTDELFRHNNMNALVKTIIDMGHTLKVQLVGEGIESLEQESVLKQNGCDFGQGFLYSKPVPAPELEQYLVKQKN